MEAAQVDTELLEVVSSILNLKIINSILRRKPNIGNQIGSYGGSIGGGYRSGKLKRS